MMKMNERFFQLLYFLFIEYFIIYMYELRSQTKLKIETYMNLNLEIKQLYSFAMI